MRKEFLTLGALALVASASAQVAIDNGPFQTHANGGPGNAPRSMLQNFTLLLNSFGFGCQKVVGNRLADDFVVPVGARLRLNGFRFFAYQSTATSNTMNDVNVRIWNGPPTTGSVIAGDPVTNLFSSGSSTGIYRTDDNGGETSSNRLIMDVRANFALAPVLTSGTYWVDWQINGTLPSGPFNVPVTILGQTGKPGANAMQFTPSVWAPVTDSTGPAQDMAFRGIGSWIINPNAFTPQAGLLFGGNLASLQVSDNDRLIFLMDNDDSLSQFTMNATSPSSTASIISAKVEWRATRTDLSQFFDMQNTNDVFEGIDFATSTLPDSTRTTIINVNAGRFIRAGNAIVSRITTIPNQELLSGDGWTTNTDLVEFEITP